MKRLLILFLLISSYCFSQSSGITYQAVIYNPNGEELPGVDNPYAPLVNQSICLQFGILNADGTIEYQEQTQVTTDAFGMVNLLIGTSTQTGGFAQGFTGIEWSADAKFLKVDLDTRGNCVSFEELSNQPFTYVPFAYYSPASDIPGPQGPEGEQGETGPQGEQGEIGETGPQGQDGAVGATGPQGPQGPQGETGPQGQNGEDGAEGQDGPPGQDGAVGATGEQGEQGPQGSPGENGEDGTQGTQGDPGPPGPTGPTGPQGEIGPLGQNGDDGEDGIEGPEGSSAYDIWISLGNTGTEQEFLDSLIGPEGPEGPAGQQGPSGSNDGTNSIGNGYIEYSLNNITDFKLSSDGQNIIIYNNNSLENTNSMRVYNLNDGVLSQKGQILNNYTSILGINSNGSRIAVTDFSTPEIDIFDLINNSWVLNATLTSNQAYYGRLSNNGNTLITITNATGSFKYFSFNTTTLQWENLFNESLFNTGRYDFNSDLQYFTTSFPIDGANFNGSLKIYNNNNSSFEQVGQTIFGDEMDFLGDHSSINEEGNVVAVTLRSNKVKIYEKVSENWIEKGAPIDLFMRPDKAFLSQDGNEIIIVVKNLYSYPMSILRYTYQNNNWNQKGSITLTKNTASVTIPSDYESGSFVIRNTFDTEPNTTSDQQPDVYTLLIKMFD
jgi:hypothetical protein